MVASQPDMHGSEVVPEMRKPGCAQHGLDHALGRAYGQHQRGGARRGCPRRAPGMLSNIVFHVAHSRVSMTQHETRTHVPEGCLSRPSLHAEHGRKFIASYCASKLSVCCNFLLQRLGGVRGTSGCMLSGGGAWPQYGNGSGSVNLYMAHGGSSWGFWSGALHAFCPTLSCGTGEHKRPTLRCGTGKYKH